MAKITVPIKVDLPEDWLDMVMERVRQDGDWQIVTRCEKCKWWDLSTRRPGYGDTQYAECTRFAEIQTENTDFCSRAEEIEEEDE